MAIVGKMNRQPLDFGYPIFSQTHINVLFWHAFIYTFIVLLDVYCCLFILLVNESFCFSKTNHAAFQCLLGMVVVEKICADFG
jgi:hypothetical protein